MTTTPYESCGCSQGLSLTGGGGTKTSALKKLSKNDLYQKAQVLEIKGRSKMSKPQLIMAILSKK